MSYLNCNMSDPDKLLNAQDIARLLQVSKPQVYLMMRRGDFPIVKMGRLVRARQSTIEAFIDKSTLPMNGGP